VKHRPVRQSNFYEIKNGKVVRKKRNCPRCGESVFMAEHKQPDGKVRYYCGKCKMVIWE